MRERRPVEPGRGRIARGQLAGPGKGRQARGRGGVREQPVEGRRQAEGVTQPAHGDLLQLGGGRARAPQHRVGHERAHEHLAEDARARGGGREVGEETRVLPVRHVGLDEGPIIGQDPLQRLGRARGGARQAGPHVARRDPRQDRPLLHRGEVVGHEIGHLVGRPAERRRVHVAPAGPLGRIEVAVGHARASSRRCELVAISATAASNASRLRIDGWR